jgi:hypothetical protein
MKKNKKNERKWKSNEKNRKFNKKKLKYKMKKTPSVTSRSHGTCTTVHYCTTIVRTKRGNPNFTTYPKTHEKGRETPTSGCTCVNRGIPFDATWYWVTSGPSTSGQGRFQSLPGTWLQVDPPHGSTANTTWKPLYTTTAAVVASRKIKEKITTKITTNFFILLCVRLFCLL